MKLKLPNKEQLNTLLSNIAEKGLVIVVVIYVCISVGRSVMKNYQINQKIEDLKIQIEILEQEKIYLDSLVAYYRTTTFKELKAREELGLKAPGEIVLAVPLEEEDLPTSEKAIALAIGQKKEQVLPNYSKWFHYFFGS